MGPSPTAAWRKSKPSAVGVGPPPPPIVSNGFKSNWIGRTSPLSMAAVIGSGPALGFLAAQVTNVSTKQSRRWSKQESSNPLLIGREHQERQAQVA